MVARRRSSKGPDNDQTNLLEAILSVMGPAESVQTRLLWKLIARYGMRFPHFSREQRLWQALRESQGCTRSVRLVPYGFGWFGRSVRLVWGQISMFLYIFGPTRVQVRDCEAAPASVILT